MCECHPRTKEQEQEWKRTKSEPNSREDWADLHNAIEEYKQRRTARHMQHQKAAEPTNA